MAMRDAHRQTRSDRANPVDDRHLHHPVFHHFKHFKGFVRSGYHTDFLGVLTRNAFIGGLVPACELKTRGPGYVQTEYPAHDEEYFEWIDLLESVLESQQQFTMVELGAGWGRWLVRATAAARRSRGDLAIRLIGVEAEPTHFEWMKQHFQDNGIDPEQHELIEAAVDEREHTIRFYVGKPDEWYGQRIAQPEETIEGIAVRDVKTITLTRILDRLELVDLIDLDVEGAELVVLRSAIEQLNHKVKRVHIGTHGPEIERSLRALFWQSGWYKRNDYAVGRAEQTEWGEIYFGNGVQTWINPRLLPVQPTAAELNWLQWTMRTSDARYGRMHDELHDLEVEPDRSSIEAVKNQVDDGARQASTSEKEVARLRQQLQGWEKHWQSVENSVGWRLLTVWRRIRDRLAPEETWRRRLYESVVGRLRPVRD